MLIASCKHLLPASGADIHSFAGISCLGIADEPSKAKQAFAAFAAPTLPTGDTDQSVSQTALCSTAAICPYTSLPLEDMIRHFAAVFVHASIFCASQQCRPTAELQLTGPVMINQPRSTTRSRHHLHSSTGLTMSTWKSAIVSLSLYRPDRWVNATNQMHPLSFVSHRRIALAVGFMHDACMTNGCTRSPCSYRLIQAYNGFFDASLGRPTGCIVPLDGPRYFGSTCHCDSTDGPDLLDCTCHAFQSLLAPTLIGLS